MEKLIIRASSARSFYEVPAMWYKTHILGQDRFEGNTNTYLGTLCHKYAECYFTLKPYDYMEILAEAPDCVDKEGILKDMPAIEKELKLYLDTLEPPSLIEQYLKGFETAHFITQGTIDAYYKEGGVLVDYKTSSVKKSSIDEYRQQLNIYAYLMALNGYEVNTIRIVNIIKATKTMPPRINILEGEADVKMGEETLRYMAEKAELAMRNPEFARLIFSPNPYSFLNN